MHKPIFAISYKKPEELQYLPDEDFVWDAIQQHGNTGIDYIDSDVTLWDDEAFQWAMNRSFKNNKFSKTIFYINSQFFVRLYKFY